MSSREPATVTVSLAALSEHGGNTASHKDGWGVVYYEDGDTRMLRDTTCASDSRWVQFVGQQEMRSTFVLSHIRKATTGSVAIKNTQPFGRELGGRMHVFAHNGHFPIVLNHDLFQIGAFRPIGDTDSEHAFCALLERIRPLWHNGSTAPELTSRFDVVSEFANDLRQLGMANFLYCDSDVLFAHGHRRKQSDGEFKPPGLHLLRRHCLTADPFAGDAGVSVTAASQEVYLVASVPLTLERWKPFCEGEVIAISGGQVQMRTLS